MDWLSSQALKVCEFQLGSALPRFLTAPDRLTCGKYRSNPRGKGEQSTCCDRSVGHMDILQLAEGTLRPNTCDERLLPAPKLLGAAPKQEEGLLWL